VPEIADLVGQKHDRNYFLDVIKSKQSVLLVADCKGKICGGLNADFADIAGYALLDNIVVAKEYRGKGISTILMRAFEKAAKKRGNKIIIALVYTWNKKMQKVVEHYRYKPSGKTIIYSKRI
jgi:GNAT superfamily N-acetyltransferase